MNSNDSLEYNSICKFLTFGLLFIGFLINCFLLVHLYFSKMKYPYTCIPTYWIIIFLITLNINSIYPVIGFIVESKDKNNNDLIKFIDMFLIKFVVMIPIIANSFSISQILKYNYFHLTRHIYHFGKEGLIAPKSYTKFYKKRFRYYKGFCFVYCLLFLFFVIFYFSFGKSLISEKTNNNTIYQIIEKLFPLFFL